MLSTFFAGSDLIAPLAYLDPGLGSMQLQIILAAFLSASFFVKSSFSQAKELVGRILSKKTA